ncbi:hypothetical protein QWJ34_09225 [Saccharibacillus sp. CPCC 101409]|uniref:hypothetical protein n=1 Tax=Saccharibacillus sp. CPCC 101409 TaxID=3058041 RepID=UPI0026718237|nr:hypothetical protein [Saccharibacillus sp. CPCC 101409]MDO3409943.1 hypothetical protein [Saccharibacillus sp. CPCC 101409]
MLHIRNKKSAIRIFWPVSRFLVSELMRIRINAAVFPPKRLRFMPICSNAPSSASICAFARKSAPCPLAPPRPAHSRFRALTACGGASLFQPLTLF